MRLAVAIPFTVALLSSATARADQCAINDQAIADKAVELAKKSTKFVEFCEPCGDKAPQGPYAITNVTAANGRVTFDGRVLDLAYTYIHINGDKYANLGIASGCTTESVSKFVIDKKPVRPPPPPPIPRVPLGPPGGRSVSMRSRVTAVDDVAGTWKITLRPNLSTCPNPAAVTTETWIITVTNGTDIVVNQGTGADDFIGSQKGLDRGMNKLQLVTSNRPSANVLQITQSLKDIVWGKIVRAESTGMKGDPACLTVLDVSGGRVP